MFKLMAFALLFALGAAHAAGDSTWKPCHLSDRVELQNDSMNLALELLRGTNIFIKNDEHICRILTEKHAWIHISATSGVLGNQYLVAATAHIMDGNSKSHVVITDHGGAYQMLSKPGIDIPHVLLKNDMEIAISKSVNSINFNKAFAKLEEARSYNKRSH